MNIKLLILVFYIYFTFPEKFIFDALIGLMIIRIQLLKIFSIILKYHFTQH